MTISKRIRYEILRRDNNTCRYCHATDSPLTIDHVVPTALGGSDDPSNLVAACKDCNAGKASTGPDAPLVAQVDEDAVRWSAAMQAASTAYAQKRDEARKHYEAFEDAWETNNDLHRYGRLRLPATWTDTIDQWLKAGVPSELITEAMEIAIRNRRIGNAEVWRYTCGIVWKRLTELQETARASLASPTPAEPQNCGHCVGCMAYANNPAPDEEPYCYTYGERDPDEDPEECDVCGGIECVPGHARSAALIEGYDAGTQHQWTLWYDSYERLQFGALSTVVDRLPRYGRVI